MLVYLWQIILTLLTNTTLFIGGTYLLIDGTRTHDLLKLIFGVYLTLIGLVVVAWALGIQI